MKRRTLLLAISSALVLGVMPAAEAHIGWTVDDTCNVRGGQFFFVGGPAQWWYMHRGSQTFAGCHMYTTNAQTRQYNYADWHLPTMSCVNQGRPIPGNHNDGRCTAERTYTGTYQVIGTAERDAHFTSRRAPYVRYAQGLARGATQTVRIDQARLATGNFLVLTGFFDTRADLGYAGFMRVSDFTGELSQSTKVGVDRIYYHPVE